MGWSIRGIPMYLFINGFTRTGHWKEPLIRPIRKKPNLMADEIGNYRPVANVSFMSKVVERVVADQLQALLEGSSGVWGFVSSVC